MKGDHKFRYQQAAYRVLLITGVFGLVMLLTAACGAQTPLSPAAPTAEPASTASSPTPEIIQPSVEAVQSTPTQSASLVPQCTSPAALTPALTEGPYYTANTPERASLLEPGMPGTQLILSGYVLTSDCQPVAHAWLDFWQADANGQYDNAGFTLRGHQYTDERGYYQLITVVPGIYPGRTEHIHFKVQAPDGPILTSQLFFPGVSENDGDNIYDPALLINIIEEGETLEATFNFIIER